VFERFTGRTRQVVVMAQDEARALKHSSIGTEHILLGLLSEEEGFAARLLAKLGVTLAETRQRAAAMTSQGDAAVVSGQIPFTPRARKALELALREALSLGHNYIGTEHLLLGLLHEEECTACRILADLGHGPLELREEILAALVEPIRLEREQRPPSFELPPLAPEFALEVQRVCEEKIRAIEDGNFARAAAMRDRERSLIEAASVLERVWAGSSGDSRRAEEPVAVIGSRPSPARIRGTQRFEHKVAILSPDDLDGSLREAATGGWELISVVTDGLYAFFKRRRHPGSPLAGEGR
jgi:hypothetical protein